MTEIEAKTKWCPMRKAESSGFDKVFGPMPSNESARCIGSACMIWQWECEWPELDHVGDTVITRQPRNTHGYCGLARKP